MTDIVQVTEKQAKIAMLLDAGHEPAAIAKTLPCSINTVYSVLKSSHYVDSQRENVLAELGGRGARIAVKALIEIAGSRSQPAAARVSAADKLLQYTGYANTESGMLDQSPATMTQAQLRNRLTELQSEAANRARPAVIEGDSVSSTNVDDLLS